MNENLNEMEEMMELENEDLEIIDLESEEEAGSGLGVKLVLAGLAGAAAVGTVVYKKIKAKKDGTPRKKKRLRWVEVEDDEFEDEDIIDSEAVEAEEPTEK